MSEKNNKGSYSPSKDRGPPAKTGFMNFLWNSETKEFLGRTGMSWTKITVFYIIFFAGLSAFFGLMLWIFYQTLDPNQPKWIGNNGLIGSNPGVGFRPMPDQDKNVESTLIWYRRSDPNDRAFWADQLAKFVDRYDQQATSGSETSECMSIKERASKGRACKVDTTKFGPCNKGNTFGYEKGEPCILIKLNKIYGWIPEILSVTDREDAKEFEKLAPEVKDHVNAQNNSGNTNNLEMVWISCEGENPADKENIGPIKYWPQPGIPAYYFPYLKQNGYQTPFIFVQLTSPTAGVLINIECKAFAKNIIPDRTQRLGSVHFELMVD